MEVEDSPKTSVFPSSNKSVALQSLSLDDQLYFTSFNAIFSGSYRSRLWYQTVYARPCTFKGIPCLFAVEIKWITGFQDSSYLHAAISVTRVTSCKRTLK